MTGNKDMLARIKARSQRPKVERDTSLAAQDKDPSASQAQAPELDLLKPVGETSEPSKKQPTSTSSSEQPSAAPINERLEQLIQVAPRRNIRLEENLDKEIERFVYDQSLTIETLLEACYLELKQNPDLCGRVLTEASKRLAERKEAGKLRRVYSQMQKLNEPIV